MAGPQRVTEKRRDDFVAALERAGGSSGNKSLRTQLGWDEEFYWKVQGVLIEEGRISAGRGMGGSVRLTQAEAEAVEAQAQEEPEQDATAPEIIDAPMRERDLYEPLKRSIETKWINRFGFDQVRVEETHSRGSRDTGGTFTRPDITAAGVKRYIYLPKRLEIVTFEVKPCDSVNVLGVLEAISHREAAHRSYVVYACSKASFEDSAEFERILELAQKYGIGVVLAADPSTVDDWEILIDAIRHEPDPARLDRFLGDLPSEAMRQQLSRWKE